MATKKSSFQANVGYVRLPSRTSEGSRAHFNKAFTKSARESMSDIIRQIDTLFRNTKAQLPEVMEAVLEPTLGLSMVYCPIKTGKLIESAIINSGFKNGKAFASITYGDGGKIHYAAMVHERTDLNHVYPTRSKFLQAALEEDLPNYKERIAFMLRPI